MRNNKEKVTSSEEMVTISRAEYEEFQRQKERISALEQQIALLTEAIRLSRQKPVWSVLGTNSRGGHGVTESVV